MLCLLVSLILIPWLSLPTTANRPSIDTFHESLLIRPLQDGKLHTRFTFQLATNFSARPEQSKNIKLLQADLLPVSILELVERFGIHQLSLSLSRGRWQFDRWSHPFDESWQGYPRGAQVATWLHPKSNSTELTHTLAGMFCASLNRLSLVESSTTPELSIPNWISNPHLNSTTSSFYHGMLPTEQPCTENLSPIFKFLPCHHHAGLSSLVNPHLLFDANWQSIRFKLVNHLHSSSHLPRLMLNIEIESVVNPVRKTAKRDWNLKSIFGKNIETVCPLSSSSKIEILESTTNTKEHDDNKERNVTDNKLRPQIEPRAHTDGLPIDGKHTYNLLKAVLPLDIEMKWPNEETFKFPTSYSRPPVSIKRLLLGHGQTKGLMGVEIEMKEEEINKENQQIIYFEEIPWWLNIYLHTCRVFVDGLEFKLDDVVTKKIIKPSIQRRRPYSFTFTIKFPTSSKSKSLEKKLDQTEMKGKDETRKMKIIYEYEKDLLLYTEYPSDANRGFDLNSAGLILNKLDLYQNSSNDDDHQKHFIEKNFNGFFDLNANTTSTSLSFWSTAGIIDLATPDFSMPYNVIIVTSTAMALFFGTVFNLLVRDFKLVKM